MSDGENPAPAEPTQLLEPLRERGFQVEFLNHARAILQVDFPEALDDIEAVLLALTFPVESIVRSGGGEHDLTQGLRRAFAARHWRKHNFEITKHVDGVPRESISHEIDHVKRFPNERVVAMEIEWNNKDPFYDRDLENFKRLHAEAAISVGVIITRGLSLQDGMRKRIRKFAESRNIASYAGLEAFDLSPTRRQKELIDGKVERGASFAQAWTDVFTPDKFGEATTHWRKLEARVHRGVGNPCPLLLIGIPKEVMTD